jgi:hypothetical protein
MKHAQIPTRTTAHKPRPIAPITDGVPKPTQKRAPRRPPHISRPPPKREPHRRGASLTKRGGEKERRGPQRENGVARGCSRQARGLTQPATRRKTHEERCRRLSSAARTRTLPTRAAGTSNRRAAPDRSRPRATSHGRDTPPPPDDIFHAPSLYNRGCQRSRTRPFQRALLAVSSESVCPRKISIFFLSKTPRKHPKALHHAHSPRCNATRTSPRSTA